MKEDPAAELGRLCRLTASLIRETAETRWPGLGHLRSEKASPLSLETVGSEVGECRRCGLHRTRKNSVFGEGSHDAALMFVGEAPGAEEDRRGRPFVGAAGQLLDRIIGSMGLERKEVFIANVIKCRPPGNRNPEPEEIAACLPYLHAQMDLIRPTVICALGKFAAQSLLETREPISRLRGSFREYRGVRLMPTFHPAYLLRNPDDKKLAWKDIQQIMSALDLPSRGESG